LPHNRIALYAGVAVLGAVAIAVGLVVLGLASWISRLMEGVH
jgi:Zn-dependent protease with chaperone function